MQAVTSVVVPVDSDVTGLEWAVPDLDALARLIAIITLGQIQHAAEIIARLDAAHPAYLLSHLVAEAKAQMRLRGDTPTKRKNSRIHRDGFLFESISWIVARQSGDARTFLKDPHLDPTMHGLDGLIIQLDAHAPKIDRATVCEDKCTGRPRPVFRGDVMTTFGEHHARKRQRDLLANAAALIRLTGVNGTDADLAASDVTDVARRFYRAALTTSAPFAQTDRKHLFDRYVELDGLLQAQRIGAVLPLTMNVRIAAELLARKVIAALDAFEKEATHV